MLEPGDPDIADHAMQMADALVVREGYGSDPFWTEEAKGLLQGLILYVAITPEEAPYRHLGRVRDHLLLNGEKLKILFQNMAASPNGVVQSCGARCLQKEEKLLASVLATAQANTHIFDSPRLRENLLASDFKFEDLKRNPTTIYLVLPADRLSTFGRWLRLMIQQAMLVNARDIATQPAKPVLFVLDEMAALGRLAMVEQAYGLMAGFGLQILGVVQDLSQLKRIYGDAYEGFIANSGVVSYYGSRDRITAEYMSALCGETTVWSLTTAIARTFGRSQTGSSTSEATTDTTAATQRKLFYPDELMRLGAKRGLLFMGNLDPIIHSRQAWFDDPVLKPLGRNLRA